MELIEVQTTLESSSLVQFNNYFMHLMPMSMTIPTRGSLTLTRNLSSRAVAYSDHKLSSRAEAHSERRLLTGFASAALMAWKLIVNSVMMIAAIPDAINTPAPMLM